MGVRPLKEILTPHEGDFYARAQPQDLRFYAYARMRARKR